ncbi:phage tail tape measure protein [Mannheimia massilioguelmaensis]|uniref:phage tail tape measure protein n=1 Tax=Mannheimia massilioguelmaensis TaxID=1604354 RepID=UPI0005C84192|nr:phage tail tape measure protein [Mannheimia massilioguelmaensis]
MSAVGNLNIKLGVDTVEFQASLNRTGMQAEQFAKKLQANFDNARLKAQQFSSKTSSYLNNIDAAMSNLNNSARLTVWTTIFSNFGGSLGSLGKHAEMYQEIANKLRLVEPAGISATKGLQSIFDISLKTNQSVDATSSVYQRFAQNAQSLGISQAQVASLTETVSKAVAISGASASAAQAALTQFGQSLASGVFRGEEFNSVMEQTPGLAQAIAIGLGVSTGELRNMAKQGQLTMDVLIPALEKAKNSVDSQFATRVVTVSGAFENLNTATIKWAGELDQTLGLSQKFVGVIGGVSQHLNAIGGAVGVGTLGAIANQFKSFVKTGNEQAVMAVAAAEAEKVRTQALREQAVTEMNLLQIKANHARTDAERLAVIGQLSAAEGKLTAAINAEAAAQRNLAVAQKQTNTLSRLGAGALSLVGGPIGAVSIALAAGAGFWLDYSQKTAEAHNKALAFANDLPTLTAEIEKMNSIQLGSEKAKAEESIIAQQQEIKKLEKTISDLENQIRNTPKLTVITDDTGFEITIENTQKLAKLNRTLATTKADLQTAQEKLNDTQDISNAISAQLADRTEEMIGFVERYGDMTLTSENRINTWADSASSAIGDFDGLTVSVNGLSGALQRLSGMSISLPSADKIASQLSDAAKQLIEKSKRQTAIINEKDPAKKAKLQAQDYALGLDKSKFSDYDIAQIEAQKEAEYLANATGRSGGKKSGSKGKKGAGTDYQKQYTDQLTEMQQRLAELNANAADIQLFGQTSQYQEVNKLTQDIATNAEKYKNFGAEGVEKLKSMATQIDSANQQVAISQFSYDNTEKLQALEFELTLLGKTKSEQELINYNHQLDVDAAKLKIGMTQENIAKLDEEIAKLKERRAEIEKQTNERKVSAVTGVKDGMAQIEDDVTDVAGNISNITTSAFDGMSSAITDLVMTGKADFKSLATSIISDISKMIVKIMLFNAIKSGMSAIGFGFSSGGYVGYATGGLVGFDDGGFTGLGGKYTPAGIVHRGEYVITKEATSRIGLDYLNYLNYGKRGFATGGGVAVPRVPSSSYQPKSAQSSISVQVINNGEPVEAKVSQKQQGEQTQITVELMRKIARQEANGAIQNNFRAGGVFA